MWTLNTKNLPLVVEVGLGLTLLGWMGVPCALLDSIVTWDFRHPRCMWYLMFFDAVNRHCTCVLIFVVNQCCIKHSLMLFRGLRDFS
jgi:hypothetical protein